MNFLIKGEDTRGNIANNPAKRLLQLGQLVIHRRNGLNRPVMRFDIIWEISMQI